jgi:hypothetical protein
LPQRFGERYGPYATLTIFQTVSEGEFSEVRYDEVLGGSHEDSSDGIMLGGRKD